MVDAVIKVELIDIWNSNTVPSRTVSKIWPVHKFVESLIENQVTFHLVRTIFPFFHIVGRGVNLTDILLHDSTCSRWVKWNVDKRKTYLRIWVFDFCLYVYKPELVVNQVVAGGILWMKHHGCGGCVRAYAVMFSSSPMVCRILAGGDGVCLFAGQSFYTQ